MRPELIEAYEGKAVKLHIYQVRDPHVRNVCWLTSGFGEIEFTEESFAELRAILEEYKEYEDKLFRRDPCRSAKDKAALWGFLGGLIVAAFVLLILNGVIS